jgi:NADPH:quinone reductase-like Zn-dependent oxidoreductase
MVKAQVTTKDLELLSQLIEAGKVRSQIDRSSRFAEIPAAVAYVEAGHARGKVVISVSADEAWAPIAEQASVGTREGN